MPRPAALAIEPLRASLAPPTLLAEVQAAWPEAAGAVLAREAQPTAERDGVVTLSCRSAVWAHELDLLAEPLVERLNAALGRSAIRRLRCVALAPPA